MKICPTCRKTYADDGLNFCLEDGSILTLVSGDAPPTVMMPSPKPTDPNPIPSSPPPTHPGPGIGYQQGTQQTWEKQTQPQQYSMQPKKKSSKSWLWVVGILGLALLFCGGGAIGLIGLAIYNSDSNSNTSNTSKNTNIFSSNTTTTPGKSPPTDGRTNLETINLERWVQSDKSYGDTDFTNGELFMSARRPGYYYVLVAPSDYTTTNANTRITVRNADNEDSKMGYGLVFHSNPSPLQQGYAFLIDAKKKRYRVVRHIPQDEPVVVNWTNSGAIKDGTQENVLEVRDKDGNIELYINDEKVTSIRNIYGYRNGVPGVYSGDGVRAAFSKLEIRN